MSTYWNGMTESGAPEKYPEPRRSRGPELRERRVAPFWGGPSEQMWRNLGGVQSRLRVFSPGQQLEQGKTGRIQRTQSL